MLAAWWRHWVNFPFNLIDWDLTPLQREVFVLLAFVGTAANVEYYREHGTTLWGEFFGRASHPELGAREPDLSANEQLGRKLAAVVVLAALGFCFYQYLLIIAAILIIYGALFYWRFKNWHADISDAVIVGLLLPLAPLIMFFAWLTAISVYHRRILKTLKYLLLLLVADIMARYAIDPLLAHLPELSYPPSAPN